MKKFITLAFSLSMLNLAAQSPVADKIQAVENGLAPNVRFDNSPTWSIEERLAHYKVPGLTIAVIEGFDIAWAKAYGVSDQETGKVNTTETAFQAASISKTINAIGVLKWASENSIDLDADINTLLKSWQFPYYGETRKNHPSPIALAYGWIISAWLSWL